MSVDFTEFDKWAAAKDPEELVAKADQPLGLLTTLRVGGNASRLARVKTTAALKDLARLLSEHSPKVPVLVLGLGSNLLVCDSGFDGVVVMLDGEFASWATIQSARTCEAASSAGTVVVRAGGAAKLPLLARQVSRAGIGGIEWMVGIPGTVGGAVCMNAGGHGSDIAACLVQAEILDLETATTKIVKAAELDLSYRHSNIGSSQVVCWAEFACVEADGFESEAKLNEIVRWRRENQPGGANCGSVFTNPVGDSAGRLIDQAGLCELRIGGAQVSDKHANFIQAGPGATACDVWELIQEVRRRVFVAHSVTLQPEVRTIGFQPLSRLTT